MASLTSSLPEFLWDKTFHWLWKFSLYLDSPVSEHLELTCNRFPSAGIVGAHLQDLFSEKAPQKLLLHNKHFLSKPSLQSSACIVLNPCRSQWTVSTFLMSYLLISVYIPLLPFCYYKLIIISGVIYFCLIMNSLLKKFIDFQITLCWVLIEPQMNT